MKARGARWEGGKEEERPFPTSHSPLRLIYIFLIIIIAIFI